MQKLYTPPIKTLYDNNRHIPLVHISIFVILDKTDGLIFYFVLGIHYD